MGGDGTAVLDRPAPAGQSQKNAIVYAVANQKGGVGKTTTTINLGAALAEQNARVLVVDLDPQAAMTVALGVDPDRLSSSLYDVLADGTDAIAAVVETPQKGMYLLPGHIDMSVLDLELNSRPQGIYALRTALAELRKQYTYILIDCPPTLGLLTMNALAAADQVLVTVQAEALSLLGMGRLLDTIDLVRSGTNEKLKVAGILVTLFDIRMKGCKAVVEQLRETFPDLVMNVLVRKRSIHTRIAEEGAPVLSFAPHSEGADDYRAVAQEVINGR